MEFDGIETHMANHRLARRISSSAAATPLKLNLLPPDDPKLHALVNSRMSDTYLQCKDQPLGVWFFRRFLHHEGASVEAKLDFLFEVLKYKQCSRQDLAAEAVKLLENYFDPITSDSAEEKKEEDKRQLLGQNGPVSTSSASSETDRAPTESEIVNSNLSRTVTTPKPLSRITSAPRPLVKLVYQKLFPQPQDIGPELFDDLAKQMEYQLGNDHYPVFVKSNFFIEYIRHLEYASRGLSSISLDTFTTYRVLGKGAFGAVSAVAKTDTNTLYAMKELNKKQLKAMNQIDTALNERDILAEVRSPFMTKLAYAFQTKESIMFVMTFCSGGDLRFHLREHGIKDQKTKLNHFSTELSRFYAAETLLALEELHSLGIVYRDLKPHNILLSAQGHVVLSDFGLAEKLTKHKSGKLSVISGTPGYWSPQVLSRTPYGFDADVWSFGVLLYQFLTGTRPKCTCKNFKAQWCTFIHQDEKLQEDLAKEHGLASYNYDISFPENFLPEVVDLCRRCLEVDPSKRITVRDIKQHPFFAPINWSLLASRRIPPPWVPEASEVHADSLATVGDLDASAYKKTKLEPDDEKLFSEMEFYSEKFVQREVVDALTKEWQKFGDDVNAKNAALAVAESEETDPCCAIL